MKLRRLAATLALTGLLCAGRYFLIARADNPATGLAKPLLDWNTDVTPRIKPTSAQVTVAPNNAPAGLNVTIAPGEEGYPGINIKPEGAAWDLAAFGHVEARLTNTGTQPISVALRVDNAGDWHDNPWNTESVYLAPGATGTVTTIFGYAYGHKPNYALKPGAIVNMMLFAGKADAAQSFRVESLAAGGSAGETPAVAPDDLRVQPANGVLLGAGITVAAPTQISALNASATLVTQDNKSTFRAVFPATQGDKDGTVTFNLTQGRWDLRDYLEVRVKLRNDGQTPVTPRVRVESNGGPSDWVVAPAPLVAGAEQEMVLPFASAQPGDLSQKGSGNHVTNDAISGVTVTAEKATAERALLVESIRAALPPAPVLPAWLGQRPPIEGEWVKTLDDEFDGPTLDTSIWSISGENYWDKTTHWSRDDVLMGDGTVKLRYEKKTGFNNDDPKQKPSNYAAGYLHTFDHWAQRYGYFEARMKLPRSPGLWPAFWMMPDRGRDAAAQGNRQDTSNGGMEFDIMEHLTRWGPNRYNIAMHYDGYGKDHKSLGADKIYLQPDKDGYITCGLLWTPGQVVYYGNGNEVLRWENPRISNVPEMLMFTLPMGGWDNNNLDDAKLPAEFTIDYVRAWQRKDLASPGDGKKPPALVATP